MSANSHSAIVDNSNPATSIFAKAMQQHAAGFLVSDGKTIPDANAILKDLLPASAGAGVFETPGRNLETLNFGTLGISIQQNLKLDQTPAIESVSSATGTKASVQPVIQRGSWVAIYGANLAQRTADWAGLIDSTGKLPTAVGEVSVLIDGKPASIYFASPGQVNVVAPDVAPGDVSVVLTSNGISTAPVKVRANAQAPAFFQWGPSPYALATRYPDNAFSANPSLGASYVAAKPGDVLILWGTGFGAVTPDQNPGQLAQGSHAVSQAVSVSAGGIPATVLGAALTPGVAGLYQIAIQLPSSLPAGDVLLKASVGGANTPDNVYVFVSP